LDMTRSVPPYTGLAEPDDEEPLEEQAASPAVKVTAASAVVSWAGKVLASLIGAP
jgi:hypothetical protein